MLSLIPNPPVYRNNHFYLYYVILLLIHRLLTIIDGRNFKKTSIIRVIVNYKGHGLTL